MIALLQRVSHASVEVDDATVGRISAGLLVLLGVERNDTTREADRLTDKLLTYRVFDDSEGKMNKSLIDIGGELLLVSQFTLAADTRTGTRPGFSTAAPPEEARHLYEHVIARARARVAHVATGRFGATMAVHLTNDGPVTFRLHIPPATPPT
jgi:D-tyrosyl-tRNA(Tyr) deacylase